MITGVVLLVGGYFLFSAKEKDTSGEEMERQIQAVTADGVFTKREKVHITKVADSLKLDKEEVFTEIKERLSANGDEAETEIVDQAKKKGDDFEKYIVKKFNQKLFTIKQWAGDKYVDGIYSEKTQQPDLIVEFKLNNYNEMFAVECKWRSDFNGGKINFSYNEQLERYKKYEKREKTNVYVALGVGGKASAPELLYLIPLDKLHQPDVSKGEIEEFKKNVDDNFYFIMKTATLDIAPYPEN